MIDDAIHRIEMEPTMFAELTRAGRCVMHALRMEQKAHAECAKALAQSGHDIKAMREALDATKKLFVDLGWFDEDGAVAIGLASIEDDDQNQIPNTAKLVWKVPTTSKAEKSFKVALRKAKIEVSDELEKAVMEDEQHS